MNSFNKRVYEMLNRIVVFAGTYPHLFGKDTLPAQLLEKIQAAIQALSGHALSQVSGIWEPSGDPQPSGQERGVRCGANWRRSAEPPGHKSCRSSGCRETVGTNRFSMLAKSS